MRLLIILLFLLLILPGCKVVEVVRHKPLANQTYCMFIIESVDKSASTLVLAKGDTICIFCKESDANKTCGARRNIKIRTPENDEYTLGPSITTSETCDKCGLKGNPRDSLKIIELR